MTERNLAEILAAEQKYDELDLDTEYRRGYQEGFQSASEALAQEITRLERLLEKCEEAPVD